MKTKDKLALYTVIYGALTYVTENVVLMALTLASAAMYVVFINSAECEKEERM